MAADPMTGFDPDTDEDLKQANARFAAAGDQATADQAQDAFTKAAPAAPQQTSGLQHWFQNLPQNIGSGLVTAAVNTADAMHSGLRYIDQKTAEAHEALGGESADKANRAEQGEAPQTPEYAEVRNAVNDFKSKYIDVQNPDMSDSITQGVAQFAIPFLGWSKAVSVVGGVGKLASIGRTMLAESATAGTAMAPHDGRFADMLDLGRHTEGKFADALNAISPDGSLVNNYIDYMTNKTDEGEAEGRAKNIVDTITGGAVLSPLITAGMRVLKGGINGLSYAMENGVGSIDQMGIPNQAGRIGYHGTPNRNFDTAVGFDNDKIGSGEGNQMYGYGHYLAEDPSVAKGYQTRLSVAGGSPDLQMAKYALDAEKGDKVKAYTGLMSDADSAIDPNVRAKLQNQARLIKSGAVDKAKGSFVTADVPDEHVASMIDHDLPLTEQPKKVQDAFAAHGIGGDEDITGGEAYKALANKFEETMPGQGPQAASALLDMRGVPGVKFLDGQSRGGGAGTRNLVVFNGKNIKILKKE